MVAISTKRGLINPKEAADLYIRLGWGTAKKYSVRTVGNMLRHSDYVVAAYSADHELIGLGRALSDGVRYTALADLIIDPDYQRQGVGRAIMEKFRKKYDGTPMFFETPKKNRRFALKCGYKERKDLIVFSRKCHKN